MTPAQILQTIRDQVNEPVANFWTDQEIYNYQWQAECLINNLTKCNEQTDSSISTLSNVAEYSMPSGVLFVTRVMWDLVRLKKIDFRELENREWLSYGQPIQASEPDSYYIFGNNIGLYPTPNQAQNVKMWGIWQPSILTSSSTSFDIPQYFHHLIPDYCMWRMWAKDQESNNAPFFKTAWQEGLQASVITWNNRLRSDRISVVKDADLYPATLGGMI
jgi:hypothetical protein